MVNDKRNLKIGTTVQKKLYVMSDNLDANLVAEKKQEAASNVKLYNLSVMATVCATVKDGFACLIFHLSGIWS